MDCQRECVVCGVCVGVCGRWEDCQRECVVCGVCGVCVGDGWTASVSVWGVGACGRWEDCQCVGVGVCGRWEDCQRECVVCVWGVWEMGGLPA